MLDHLIRIARLLSSEMRRRRELRELLERDDRFLNDIGVTRADVHAALQRPVDLEALRRDTHSQGECARPTANVIS